jgi:hypothetical protein
MKIIKRVFAAMVMCVIGGGALVCHDAFDFDLDVVEAMTKGGDSRILRDASGRNRYFTSPAAQPALVARSSTTSSYASTDGFAAAEALFAAFKTASNHGVLDTYYAHTLQNIRETLKAIWAATAQKPCQIITSPSGTYPEMLVTIAALARHEGRDQFAPPNRPLVTNIVVAQGEIGSNSGYSAELRHANPLTPRGTLVMAGTSFSQEIAQNVRVVEVGIRSTRGALLELDEIEKYIEKMLQRVIDIEGQVGVLHLVHASKTGMCVPRESFVAAMKKQYGHRLLVVVDAAQARMKQEQVSHWLDQNFWVFLTGSKFFGGPSFSGALFIPESEARLFAQIPSAQIPSQLSDYFNQYDYDDYFTNFKAMLPAWYNIGLALRWSAVLPDIKHFYSFSSAERQQAINRWATNVRDLVRATQQVSLLEEVLPVPPAYAWSNFEGECNTVIPCAVAVTDNAGQRSYLGYVPLLMLHELMAKDISGLLPDLNPAEDRIARAICLIGQPVQIGSVGECTAAVRIAITARGIVRMMEQDGVAAGVVLQGDDLVVKKIDLIAKNWQALVP